MTEYQENKLAEAVENIKSYIQYETDLTEKKQAITDTIELFIKDGIITKMQIPFYTYMLYALVETTIIYVNFQ